MSKSTVSDQDLMRWLDGELEPERSDQVEAELDQSERARAVVATLLEVRAQVQGLAERQAGMSLADDIANSTMARIAAEDAAAAKPTELIGRVPALAANSGRRVPSIIYAFGGLAAAAAAALIVWSIGGVDVAPPSPVAIAAPSAVESSTGAAVASADVPPADDDPEPSVSVDAVDFGARTGTIFYVPADTGTTTIVWLSDDESGGK